MFNNNIRNPFFNLTYFMCSTVLISVYTHIKRNFGYNKPFKQGKFFYEYQYLNTMIFVSMVLSLILILVINRRMMMQNHMVFFVFTVFILVLYYLVFSNSIFTFFMSYEALLLLTAVTVNWMSPNIRSKVITLYFILWTQLSSFFLWISIIIIYYHTRTFLLNHNVISIPDSSCTLIKYLVFLSLSIKMPLWPFSFWLIKTHVEANTSFSIFLSGVLVKSALVGFLKFHYYFIDSNNTLIMYIVFLSILTTTFAIGIQIDFKKLIAYTTVQEMSIIIFFILYNNFVNLNIIVYFVLLHTLNSILLFFLNDLLYTRFKTRKTKLLLGLSKTAPKLNAVLLIIWFLLTSLPLTFKFVFEVTLLLKILSLPSFIITIFIMSVQLISVIFLTMNFLPYSFGNGFNTTFDISKVEFSVFIICTLVVVYLII